MVLMPYIHNDIYFVQMDSRGESMRVLSSWCLQARAGKLRMPLGIRADKKLKINLSQ